MTQEATAATRESRLADKTDRVMVRVAAGLTVRVRCARTIAAMGTMNSPIPTVMAVPASCLAPLAVAITFAKAVRVETIVPTIAIVPVPPDVPTELAR